MNRFTQQVTNLGSRPVTVQASSRTLGTYTRVKTATVTLDDATSPKVDDWYGISVDNYAKITFTVPAGADRLETSVIWQGDPYLGWAQPLSSGFTTPDITLIDPRGRLANASAWKKGSANHHGVQVSDPLAGTWTAYVVGWNSVPYGGWNGPVQFEASVAHYVPFGTVTPSTLVLPPGANHSVTLSVTTPATPGDVAGSLVLSTPGQPAQTAPVTLRTLLPRGRTSFSGTLTGAEGSRGGEAYEAATTYYQVDVPPSAKASTSTSRSATTPTTSSSCSSSTRPDRARRTRATASSRRRATEPSATPAASARAPTPSRRPQGDGRS